MSQICATPTLAYILTSRYENTCGFKDINDINANDNTSSNNTPSSLLFDSTKNEYATIYNTLFNSFLDDKFSIETVVNLKKNIQNQDKRYFTFMTLRTQKEL